MELVIPHLVLLNSMNLLKGLCWYGMAMDIVVMEQRVIAQNCHMGLRVYVTEDLGVDSEVGGGVGLVESVPRALGFSVKSSALESRFVFLDEVLLHEIRAVPQV